MPTIKPISDMRNYNEVLRNIDVGSPVFLTKNGRGRYVITDIKEYEQQQAEFKLLSELLKAEASVKEKGWVCEEEADAMISDL
ncbi:MAG: prevent-host-death protein [Clostridiales bacterium]|jgi:PHD/YefM family antitoxin component YafN of YafNO toxin-antitoxin module|nr:prevent-host-death protein [Clostridiales bacterium]